MKHLRLQHPLLFERNVQPLLDTPLVGGRTQKRPYFVAVWNTQPLHDTRLVDGTCTSSTSNSGRYETSTRIDDVLPTTSTSERTSYVTDDGGLNDESDVDPPQEPGPDGVEVVLFFEPELVPTELKDVEGGSDEEEEDLRLRCHMGVVDGYALDSSLVQLPVEVVAMGVGRMTHLDRIKNVEVFASPHGGGV
ncbi:hypothetical protein J1N35_034909 [Gossypium stocksii]|uniref:Uncharacterized protein n=1 Tax=Gossypium stocksii TaxID=47602 RepID=A0A9D3ZQG0_9ROSI|nr:hypothetical protein J1N35_034909 [Gossypium stocksii]